MVNINPNIGVNSLPKSQLGTHIGQVQKPELVNTGSTEIKQVDVASIVSEDNADTLGESTKEYPGGSMQDVVNDFNNGNYDKTGKYGNLADGWAYIIVIDDDGNSIIHFHTGQYKPEE